MRRSTAELSAGDASRSDKGLQLFLKFARIELTEQVRCASDPEHGDICREFRYGDPRRMRDYLARHILNTCDAAAFGNAEIFSPGNEERCVIGLDKLN